MESLQVALLLVIRYAGALPVTQLQLSIQSPAALRCDQVGHCDAAAGMDFTGSS